MKKDFDCIVIGAGTAGVVASIQAAAAGTETLLIERSGQPGGTMTSALIAFPGLFYAWKKQIISGIGWDLVRDCAALAGTPLPKFEEQDGMKEHPRYQVNLQPALYAALCDERMTKSGVQRLYHAMPFRANFSDGRWSLSVATQNGIEDFSAKVVVDCTGDAAFCGLAGFERRMPETVQPATYSCRMSGYDPEKLDWAILKNAAEKAIRHNELKYTDLGWNASGFSEQFLRCFGNNANHLFPEHVATAEGRSQLEVDARASLLRAYRFLKKQPGLEHLRIDCAAPECGVRESAVIVGEHTVTGGEYCSGTCWPDSVAYAIYPIDIHEKSASGVTPTPLKAGIVPTIPLRALIPRGSRNLLAAGRCISSDRIANSALRVQASCMAGGQAAGAAAVLSVRLGLPPLALDPDKVRSLLAEYGAIIPK